MQEIEFNLLDEPWIRVQNEDCSIAEVSLTDALLSAHRYKGLAGETATQDAAILRLLLAVLHTVYSRVDESGENAPLTSVDDALIRWGQLWALGHFEEKPIRDYLVQWHERFWLFHPERPFWQVASVKNGIAYSAAMLNGEISQGENRDRLFSNYSGSDKDNLTYPQAARWLLYVNAYDVRGGRPKAGNKPRHGTSWLGGIGYVNLKGASLYETLLLNLVLIKDKSSVWGYSVPCWELEHAREEQSSCICMPDNQAEFLTMQSRRILLKRDKEHDVVTGCELLGGDYIDAKNADIEQMTVWERKSDKGSEISYYAPKQHDVAKQLWREIPSLLTDEAGKLPGIIEWNNVLKEAGIIPDKRLVVLQAVGMKYDSQGASHKQIYTDTAALSLAVLGDLKKWSRIITLEVGICERMAYAMYTFGKEMALAGGADIKNSKQWGREALALQERFFYCVDQPFRDWLRSIDTEWDGDELDASCMSWRNNVQAVVRDIAKETVRDAEANSIVGHKISTEQETIYYSASIAYNNLLKRVRNILKDER